MLDFKQLVAVVGTLCVHVLGQAGFSAGSSSAAGVSALSAPLSVEVEVDWAKEKVLSHTAATVEVDVMPFLGRADWGACGPTHAAACLFGVAAG